MATYKNFSISRKQGKFYLKEKQPTEGFQEITYGTEGKKTYHQYHDSVSGMPTYFGTKEVEYDGRTLRFLELTLEDGDVINKISAPLKNRGGYTDEVKALVSSLNGYDMGEPVTINPKTSKYMTAKGVERENLNIYINYNNRKNAEGKNEGTGYIKFEDVPSPTSSIVAGDTVWDWSPQTQFYYDKIQEIETKFKSAATSTPAATTTVPSKNPIPTATPQQAFGELDDGKGNEHDNLPF